MKSPANRHSERRKMRSHSDLDRLRVSHTLVNTRTSEVVKIARFLPELRDYLNGVNVGQGMWHLVWVASLTNSAPPPLREEYYWDRF